MGMVLILIFGEVLGLYGYNLRCWVLCTGILTYSQAHRRPDIKHEQQRLGMRLSTCSRTCAIFNDPVDVSSSDG